jgi:hypothetical protein
VVAVLVVYVTVAALVLVSGITAESVVVIADSLVFRVVAVGMAPTA